MPDLPLGIDSRKAKTGAAQFKSAVSEVSSSATKGSKSVDSFGKSMAGGGDSATRFGSKLKGLIAVAGGLSVFRQAATTIAGFEQTMATIQGVTSATEEQMKALSDTARDLGATTKFSAQEAGEGLLFLSRAGFEVEEALEAIPATLDLAIVGMLELGDAADIASNVLAQFGLQAKDTVRVVDVLANTANSSNTDVRQLAEALKFAGPVAGALGITIEETAAAIGALGDAGIQASTAGTNLRGIMAALLNPTSKAKATLEELGIALEDVNPEKNNLTEIFKQFGDANLGAADAVSIFNKLNVGSALILSQSADKVRDLTAANEESSGVARKNAALIENTLAGAYAELLASVDEVFLALGSSGLEGALTDTVRLITENVRAVSEWIKANEDTVQTIGSVTKTVLQLVVAYRAFKVLQTTTALVSGFSSNLIKMGTAATGSSGSLSILTANLTRSSTAMAAARSASGTLTRGLGTLFKAANPLIAAFVVLETIDLASGLLSANSAVNTLSESLENMAGSTEDVNKQLVSTKEKLLALSDNPFVKYTPAIIFADQALRDLNDIQELVLQTQAELLQSVKGAADAYAQQSASTKVAADRQLEFKLQAEGLNAILGLNATAAEKNALAFRAQGSELQELAASANLTDEQLIALAKRQDELNRLSGSGSEGIERRIKAEISLRKSFEEIEAAQQARIQTERQLTEFTKQFAKERQDAVTSEVEATRASISTLISDFDKLNAAAVSPQEGLLDLQERAIGDLDNQAKVILAKISEADAALGSLATSDFKDTLSGELRFIPKIEGAAGSEIVAQANVLVEELNRIAAEKLKIGEVIKSQIKTADAADLELKAVAADKPLVASSEEINTEGTARLQAQFEASTAAADALIERQVRLNELTSAEGAAAKGEAEKVALETQIEGIDELIIKQNELREISQSQGGTDTTTEAIAELTARQNELKQEGLELDRVIAEEAAANALAKRDAQEVELASLEEFLAARVEMIELSKLNEIERITALEEADKERELEAFEARQILLREGLEASLLTKEEFAQLELDNKLAMEDQLTSISEKGDQDRLNSRLKTLKTGLGATQDILSSINNIAKAFGKKGLEDSKAFGITQAAISTAIGIAKALELGFPAAIPAIALATTTGLAQIAAITSGSPPSGGGSAPTSIGNPSGGSANSPGGSVGGGDEVQINKRQLSLIVRGNEQSVGPSTRSLMREMADEVNNGGADTVDLTFENA